MATETSKDIGGDDYRNYVIRVLMLKENITKKIENLTDPIEAISVIVDNEGLNLKAVWETDSGYPFDAVVFCIVILPIFLGMIGLVMASFWEPKMHGRELYDEYGNRIVEFPKMPIAYLQQTHKDVSAVRENRNSLSWLCHRWLIATNDVVQELQSPYPLEDNMHAFNWGPLNGLIKWYNVFLDLTKSAKESRSKARTKAMHKRKTAELSTIKTDVQAWQSVKAHLQKPSSADVAYLVRNLWKARRLWWKLLEWSRDAQERPYHEKVQKQDQWDSYWSSSETFSSDSGQHWKSYKSNVHRWLKVKQLDAGWAQEKRRRIREKEAKTVKRVLAGTGNEQEVADLELPAAKPLPPEMEEMLGKLATSPSAFYAKNANKLMQKKFAGNVKAAPGPAPKSEKDTTKDLEKLEKKANMAKLGKKK